MAEVGLGSPHNFVTDPGAKYLAAGGGAGQGSSAGGLSGCQARGGDGNNGEAGWVVDEGRCWHAPFKVNANSFRDEAW